jgi:glycerophosphoryl diester phosphodiesterase
MGVDRRMILAGIAGGAGLSALTPAAAVQPPTVQPCPVFKVGDRPLVIAHRGASGDRPEHTLASYRLAIAQGCDYIEPDVVISKDGVLICRHENEIGETTDVGARREFADRRRTKIIDGGSVAGWFAEDFLLSELKTLRCRERLPQLRPDNTAFNGREPIPTLEEVIDLALTEGARLQRPIGVYPETKHPSYHRALGLPLEPPLVALLKAKGLDRSDAPVFIQSFEVGNLKALRGETSVRLVQLIAAEGGPFDRRQTVGATYQAMLSDAGLAQIGEYAAGIGPQKNLVMTADSEGRTAGPTDLVARAKAAGLLVHPWTFRAENHFLAADLRRGNDPRAHGDLLTELMRVRALGVDGWFVDHPGLAAVAREMSDT